MKIIQITPNFPPSIGGVQNCVKEISLGLSKNGHEVFVFTSDEGINGNHVNYFGNIKVNYLKTFYFAHTPIIPSLFFKLMAVQKDSIMHVHISKAYVPEITYIVSKIRNIPYIAHFHLDVGPSGSFGFLLPFYKNIFLKKVLMSAAKIIVLNKNYKKIMSEKYGIEKNVVVIPNGVSKKFFNLRKKKNVGKPANLLYVGRLSVQKAVDRLIMAMTYLKNKAVLHIVGDGELKNQLKSLIIKLKLKNVFLEGPKKNNELLKYYKSADIFVLSSLQEGHPLVLSEAMAAGIPVVASDVMGNHEYVGDTGILVNPPAPEKFAGAIDNLINSKALYKKLVRKGIKKAENFTWTKIISKIERVYSQVSR